MSYDLRLAVRVYGAENIYAVIDEPQYNSPTYNIGEMLRKCTGWNFEQGKWYKASDVLPMILTGIFELENHEDKYKKYNSPNGWGDTKSALQALKSLSECIHRNNSSGWTWHEIPLDCLYVAW